MSSQAFISYSHADEKSLDRLHKHLAVMNRDGSLKQWDDRVIRAGDRLDAEIKKALESATIFLALVSPDYLASNYCYEWEFQYAQELEKEDKLKIVPIILEPCDWLSSPFREYRALPKDGLPISQWANQNNAYLDVVNGLRRALADEVSHEESRAGPASSAKKRSVKVKRDFDSIDKSEFAEKAFRTIQEYFRLSCSEISGMDSSLRAKFEEMGDAAFTCTVVNRAKMRGGEAHITVRLNKGGKHFGSDISYTNQRHAEGNSSNGGLSVQVDEYNLYLKMDFGFRNDEGKISPEQAAELIWKEFAQRAGIEYE